MKKYFKYGLWAILIAGALAYFYATTLSDGRLHVYALDVGQGDALLIRTPSDEFILVDGGPNDAVLNELADVMPFYRRDIALVILTHPHADHVDGLVEVVRRYEVERSLITGIDYSYPGYRAFLDAVAERGVTVDFADGEDMVFGGSGGVSAAGGAGGGVSDAGDDVVTTGGTVGGAGGVTLDFVYPLSSLQGRTFTNINNSSIVFRLIYGKTVFLFEGDCELECEEKMLAGASDDGGVALSADTGAGGNGGAGHADLRADVLKVGHHGSRTASSEAFLDAVAPDYAMITCGEDNSFKHPHPETVEKLQERGVRIFRTDIDGRVEFVSDGERLEVR